MKKVLYVANTDSHILLCHIPYLKMFKEKGYEVHVATNTTNPIPYCDKKIAISITRNPFHLKNFKAIKELKKIVKEEKYDIVSCHTPMGGVIARLASKGSNAKVYYTAHGFHFYKGAPIINWLTFYPIEKILSKNTDVIITMNDEDYKFAKKHFKTTIKHINGIGFNPYKLQTTTKENLRKKYHLKDTDFIIIYVAELSKRKRQIALLKKISKSKLDDNVKLLLVGNSILKKDISYYINKYNLNKKVIYIPFQKDIAPYYNLADMVISVSTQEGLPLNILEAMYLNKKIIATNIRGHQDLLTNYTGAILVPKNLDFDLQENINKLKKIKPNKINLNKYTYENVIKEYLKIYF